MAWRVRRVVTGHDGQGRSVFLTDGLAPNIKEMESMTNHSWSVRGNEPCIVAAVLVGANPV